MGIGVSTPPPPAGDFQRTQATKALTTIKLWYTCHLDGVTTETSPVYIKLGNVDRTIAQIKDFFSKNLNEERADRAIVVNMVIPLEIDDTQTGKIMEIAQGADGEYSSGLELWKRLPANLTYSIHVVSYKHIDVVMKAVEIFHRMTDKPIGYPFSIYRYTHPTNVGYTNEKGFFQTTLVNPGY